MTAATRITAVAHLQRGRICLDQVELFREALGESAELTPESWQRAGDAGLDQMWLTSALTPQQWKAYKAAHAPLWARYNEAHAKIWTDYHTACLSLLYTLLTEES